MTNDDIEDRVRRFRPAGPSPALRARVLTAAPAARTWPWAAAAAAVLVLTTVLRAASGSALADVREEPPDLTAAAVERLAAALGGGDEAHRLAEAITIQEQIRLADTRATAGMEAR